MSLTDRLYKRKLITPPLFLVTNVHYETETGSVAYGCSGGNSDIDIYGFCIPPKDIIFPHLAGHIDGFGKKRKRFDQFQSHHVVDKDKGVKYDLTIYNIIKYFQLCMENNPNIIDSLFTPTTCVRHATRIGHMVRENRELFLHKGSWHKFRGYAFSQMHKMDSKEPNGKRVATIEKYGYDVKFAYHVVRLLLECEQILETHTIDLQRDREILKAIRRGDWTKEEIKQWFSDKEKHTENLYATSKLQKYPDEEKIRILLLECLEQHYGDLSTAVVTEEKAVKAIREIKEILVRNKL